MKFLKKLFNINKSINKWTAGNKINIAIELSSFDKGGLEKVVLDSALRLNAEIFNILIISVQGKGHWADVAESEGIRVYALNERQESYRDILIENRIHLSCSHFSRTGYPLFHELGIPNITFIHNVYAFIPEDGVKNFKNDDKYIDKYISVSKNATKYAVNRLGISKEKITTIANGLIVDEHERRSANAKAITRGFFGLAETDYVFLNVASYNLHKGHYLMADAMREIRKKRNDIKIICIGNEIYPPHVAELKTYISQNGLSDFMLMPGYFSEIEAFHKISDAFLLPSFIEGWSIAMNEAMFYEKPMILTDTGGSAEVIESNDIGILIPNEFGDVANLDSTLLDKIAYDTKNYKTTENLVAAMIDFASNKEKWNEAAKLGKTKITEKYNFNHIVAQYEEIFRGTLIQRDRPFK